MQSIIILTVVGLLGKSAVEAFGAASTSNVRSVIRSAGDMEMKLFDWKQRELFENYVVPDGDTDTDWSLWRKKLEILRIIVLTAALFIYYFIYC